MRVSGRKLAIQALDALLEKSENIQILSDGLENALRTNPVGFFKAIILPTLPKETLISVDQQSDSPIRIELVPKVISNTDADADADAEEQQK